MSNSAAKDFKVIAHRGGALEAPENTLFALKNAAKISPHIWMEIDVHLSLDKEVVVIHDGTLERTTNGRGMVSSHTLKELKALDAGYNFLSPHGNYIFRDQGIQIPTLKEVLTELPNTHIILEFKNDSIELVEKTLAIIKEFKALEYMHFYSQTIRPLIHLKQIEPKSLCGAPPQDIFYNFVNSRLPFNLNIFNQDKVSFYSLPTGHFRTDLTGKRFVKRIKQQGKPVYYWTINDRASMLALLEMGADGLITDKPSVLQTIYDNYKSKS